MSVTSSKLRSDNWGTSGWVEVGFGREKERTKHKRQTNKQRGKDGQKTMGLDGKKEEATRESEEAVVRQRNQQCPLPTAPHRSLMEELTQVCIS